MKQLILISLLLLAGCVSSTTDETRSESALPVQDVSEPVEILPVENDPVEPNQNTIREFEITAKNWEFIPKSVTVNEGDHVILHVTSVDVAHGIRIPEFGVNERLEPGKKIDIEFVADKKGTFTTVCSVFCGQGHGSMRGAIIVE